MTDEIADEEELQAILEKGEAEMERLSEWCSFCGSKEGDTRHGAGCSKKSFKCQEDWDHWSACEIVDRGVYTSPTVGPTGLRVGVGDPWWVCACGCRDDGIFCSGTTTTEDGTTTTWTSSTAPIGWTSRRAANV